MKQSIPIEPFESTAFEVEIRPRRNVGEGSPAPQTLSRLKTICCVLALVPLLGACASQPLSLAPVGPGPAAWAPSSPSMGDLQVYTEPEEYYADQMSYFPHTDYQLYAADGRHLRRVWNHNTHEDETPAIVSLPPGRYAVQAWAEFYGLVSVPVVIEPNKLTKVVLQPGWNPRARVKRSALVQMPQGYFVGYRAELAAVK